MIPRRIDIWGMLWRDAVKKRIAVGMSGGVDSSVTAALLVEQGCDVLGVYIEAYNESGCRSDQDRQDALKVATQLGISFQVLDLKKEYRESVIKYFYDEYRAGRTPNPDVMCNSRIKFGLFLDWAREQGYDKIATGHYAKIKQVSQYSSDPVFQLKRGKDQGKDQSYFLWRVGPERLRHVMFPLGEMSKSEVRGKAKEIGLSNWNKSDSMGVCMMGEMDVAGKLRDKLGEKVGEVIMKIQNNKLQNTNKSKIINNKLKIDNNVVVGEHQGLWFSTIGQRVGSEISLRGDSLKVVGVDTTKMPALYVVGKDVKRNQIIIGTRENGYVKQVRLRNTKKYVESFCEKIYLRVRNLGEMIEIESFEENNDEWEIKLIDKVWGVASGQSGVIYADEGRVVGGGEIV